MLSLAESVLPHWSADLPGYGSVLACRCFANEECGNYTIAEHAGRAAIERDPGDLWATHGIAHVLEMQGRRGEGIAWITGQESHFDGGNNLMHHIWWHQAMFHIERGEFDAVLALYDTRFRNLDSKVTQAQPDLYIDMQNAASMLFRLQLRGIDPGDRWQELADKAEKRVGDTLSAFTLPHWIMALMAAGRHEAAARMLGAIEAAAQAPGAHATILREAALPVGQAVRLHALGDYDAAVRIMRPALGGMYRLGGSHAQQEVLELLFLDAAMKADRRAEVRLMLERVAGRHPMPPARRIGFAEAALAVPF
jgi:tetratricopeptide (TPR) repeat protein